MFLKYQKAKECFVTLEVAKAYMIKNNEDMAFEYQKVMHDQNCNKPTKRS